MTMACIIWQAGNVILTKYCLLEAAMFFPGRAEIQQYNNESK
jgi:hypothetical protein